MLLLRNFNIKPFAKTEIEVVTVPLLHDLCIDFCRSVVITVQLAVLPPLLEYALVHCSNYFTNTRCRQFVIHARRVPVYHASAAVSKST